MAGEAAVEALGSGSASKVNISADEEKDMMKTTMAIDPSSGLYIS